MAPEHEQEKSIRTKSRLVICLPISFFTEALKWSQARYKALGTSVSPRVQCSERESFCFSKVFSLKRMKCEGINPYMGVYTYIYIYTHACLSLSFHIYTYIQLYIYVYLSLSIYIYICPVVAPSGGPLWLPCLDWFRLDLSWGQKLQRWNPALHARHLYKTRALGNPHEGSNSQGNIIPI